jgi:hypothetical protein
LAAAARAGIIPAVSAGGERGSGMRGAAWLAAAACVGGAALRVLLAGDAALWGDEFHSLRLWRRGFAEILAGYDRYGSGLALPLLQRVAADVFGESVASARIPALTGGVLSLALTWPVARRIAGPWPAALALLGLALSPLHLFYSHFGRAYTLVVLLALVLADGIRRLVERPASRAGPLEIGAAAALLPWVHLAAGAVVAAGALGAALAAPRAARRPLAAALALGTLLCVLLHLPAREALLGFVGIKAGRGEAVAFGPLDVAAVVSGGRAAGLVWLVAVPAATVAWLRERGAAGAPLVALALVPLAVVAIVDPISNAVAFARYLIGSLPFALLLLAWGALRAGEALGGRAGRAAAAAAVVVLFVAGAAAPLAPALARRDGPFANTYLGLHPLAAFDAAPPSAPPLYRQLGARAEVGEVVEVPAARLGGALLYRALAREHGKPVRLGFLESPPARARGAAYLAVDAAGGCRGVRVVVAHLDLPREVRAYLAFVAGALPARDAPVGEPLVLLPPVEPTLTPEAVAALRARLGPTVHEDAGLLVWEVPCGEGPG